MIAKFILIAVFVHGHGPRSNYANLGEYNTIVACRAAAQAVAVEHAALDLIGDGRVRFICASKG
jgi:hypothetical protein